MTRVIEKGIDALFVEGPDDGVVVNALIERYLKVDIARLRLVRAAGGWPAAMREFEKLANESGGRARIGVIIDRDGGEGQDDNWPSVKSCLSRLGEDVSSPLAAGHLVKGRLGIWMWPDNVNLGDLEHFVHGLVPRSDLLGYAEDTSLQAKNTHGAEYDPRDLRKAAFKVRSIWRDASAAGGYGHLLRALPLVETPSSVAFREWFRTLFLKD